MLEKSVEITLSDMAEADLTQSSELFLTNLHEGARTRRSRTKLQKQPVPLKDGQPATGISTADDEHELPIEPKYFFYDEWDFRAADYKPRWCRVGERTSTRARTTSTRRRCASTPALVERDAAPVRAAAAGDVPQDQAPPGRRGHRPRRRDRVRGRAAGPASRRRDKIYWRRNKIERDVAVAFLLDMSASTDEEIEKHERQVRSRTTSTTTRAATSQWWSQRRAQELLTPPKRIIDLEKESIVLLIKALETIGDRYGIYGFSGYGRDNVEFYVIKDLEEPFGEHDQAPHRQDRADPLDAHGPGDPPHDVRSWSSTTRR